MDAWFQGLKARATRKESTRNSNESALHEACYSGCTLNGLKEILALHPEAIAMKDSKGFTPLHWSIASKRQHSKARELLDYFTRGNARFEDENDCLNKVEKRTHTRRRDQWLERDRKLIRHALLQKTDMGDTALHLACKSNASPDLLRDMLLCCPEAATIEKGGKTMLHMIVEYVRAKETSMSTDSIRLLLEAYPEAVRIADRLGNTPLHYACYPTTDVEAFEILLQASFGALSITNEMKQTPLHCACISNAPIPIVNALIEANPHMVMNLDHLGNSPLHLACKYNTSAILMSRLLIEAEEVLGVENYQGQTPLQMCKDLGHIYSFLRLVPQFAQR